MHAFLVALNCNVALHSFLDEQQCSWPLSELGRLLPCQVSKGGMIATTGALQVACQLRCDVAIELCGPSCCQRRRLPHTAPVRLTRHLGPAERFQTAWRSDRIIERLVKAGAYSTACVRRYQRECAAFGSDLDLADRRNAELVLTLERRVADGYSSAQH